MKESDARHRGTSPLWITEADVGTLLSLRDAIVALERVLLLETRGQAQNMLKTHARWGRGDTLHAIGAVVPGSGCVGTKTWAHTEHGATPLLILFDSADGRLRAVVEAFALGQMRTSAVSAVATDRLARADADDLAIIGTGKQALSQVAGIAAVRPLQHVRVFSPNPEHRTQFADRLRAQLDCAVSAATSVAEAVAGVSIITLVTRATEPFLKPEMVAPGSHVNAVGAITPERAEFVPAMLARCAVVAADSVPSVEKLSCEFAEYYGSGCGSWADVLPLSRIVAEQRRRSPGADLTLFKAMGMGLADLALGIEVYNRAVERGVGRPLEQPRRG